MVADANRPVSMDQSISFLGAKGTAKLIEFNPLRADDVVLPPGEDLKRDLILFTRNSGAVFVISNSLVEANKYVSAGSCYNKR